VHQLRRIIFMERRIERMQTSLYINVLLKIKKQVGLPNKKWTPVYRKLPLPQAQGFRGPPLPSSRRQCRAVACEPTLTARGFQGLDPVI